MKERRENQSNASKLEKTDSSDAHIASLSSQEMMQDKVVSEQQTTKGRPKASPLASSISKAYSPTKQLTHEEIRAHNSFGFFESLRNGAYEMAPSLFTKPNSSDYKAKEFFYLHKKMQQERSQINSTVNILRSSIIEDSRSAKSAQLFTKLNQNILRYQQTKQQVYELYQSYLSFSDAEKESYWKRVTGYKDVTQTLELFDKMHKLLQSPEDERFETLDADFFLAFHDDQGQVLMAELLTGIERHGVDFKVKHGNAIQVEPTPKVGFNISDLSAQTGWSYDDFDDWANLSVDEFFVQLQKQMKPGSPEALGNITLAYAQEGSVPFGYTVDKDGKAQSYLVETYVTFLHELGHAAAILRGDFFDNHAPLPKQLMHYHQLEEFLNIRFRTINETTLDPLGIERVGHTGIEFQSLKQMQLEDLRGRWGEEFLIDQTQEEINMDRIATDQLKENGVIWQPTKPDAEHMEMKQNLEKSKHAEIKNYRKMMFELRENEKENVLDNEDDLKQSSSMSLSF